MGLLPVLLRYLPLTLQMATIAMFFALILACLLAVVRVSKVPFLNGFSLLFISFSEVRRCWFSCFFSTMACRS
ncbi:hypothetical protein HORIV_58600 [Vreelandella olivaria]|uniref:ATP synthase F0 subunit 8 n=1 Tax=Vreelandella olivaria TaxID=390919 RepID=A0ABM7GRJ1_9GAMM|nr:hypothetical protein HORIV_58600 [Halomonas olivaria]